MALNYSRLGYGIGSALGGPALGATLGNIGNVASALRQARPQPSGRVLGSTTYNYGGGGGSSGGGGGNQSANFGSVGSQNLSGVLETDPGQPQIDYDALIAPALQALDQSIAPQESAYQANLAEIEAGRQKGVRGQQSALAEATSAADQARSRNTNIVEQGVNEQRRQYSEIGQGLQARYGGTTGTGRFATELAGAQTLKNVGQLRQSLSEAISGIDSKLEEVRGVTQIAIQDIEDQAQAQKLKAKSDLDAALNQIRIARGELQSRKAELASQAYQFYQQQLAGVNQRNAAFKQQLFQQQQQAEAQLASARQRASGAAKNFAATTIAVDPNTGAKIYGAFNKATGQATPFAGGSLGVSEDDEAF